MALQPGDELQNGKYTVVKELGKGRFGVTYLAKDSHGNNLVIKTLLDRFYDGEYDANDINNFHNKLLREAQKLQKCNNPHIVKCQDVFIEPPQQRIYLAMEYIAGPNLGSLSDKTLPPADALKYIKQIGKALTEVHQNGLLHLDVKPDNIILKGGKPEVVLIDFGLAKGLDDSLTSRNTSTADGFAALELYDPNAERGPYTDVYGLAATLYFLLTGTKPPSAEKISLKRENLVPLKELNSKVSNSVSNAIIQGMQLDWKERPQTMAKWLALLPPQTIAERLKLFLLPAVKKEPESSNSEREDLKLSKQQIIVGIIGIIVTALVGLYSQETREKIEQILPSPSPTPTPVESPSQE